MKTNRNKIFDFASLCELKTEKKVVLEVVNSKKPAGVSITKISEGKVFVQFNYLNSHEMKVISDCNVWDQVEYKCIVWKKGEKGNERKEYSLEKTDGGCFAFTPDFLDVGTAYTTQIKMMFGEKESELSDEVEFTTPEFKDLCVRRNAPIMLMRTRNTLLM